MQDLTTSKEGSRATRDLDMTNDQIAVLIPCFNEEATIEQVVTDFRKELPSARIYVYDNASTDDTAEVAAAAGAMCGGKVCVVRGML